MTVPQTSEGAPQHKFELSNAVTLFAHEVSTINALWTTYVVATFAAAGYGLSGGLGIPQAIAVSLGFLTFAVGNGMLLMQALSITWQAEQDIRSALEHFPS